MRASVIFLAATLLLVGGGTALAQSAAGPPSELGVVPYPGPVSAGAPSTSSDANRYATPVVPHNDAGPYLNEANPYASTIAPRRAVASPYLNEANPYASTAAPPHAATNPGATAAARQSGLSNVQARNVIELHGYTRIGEIYADPNSVWVWQADAMKDGRRVRIGIDYRGNLLELGGGARPCAAPQTGFGPVSPLGTGVRLYESSSCSDR